MAEPYTGRPMDLGNMRYNGCRSITLYCRCKHEATVNVDAYPDHLAVPDMRQRFRCSKCGQRPYASRPNSLELGQKLGTRPENR